MAAGEADQLPIAVRSPIPAIEKDRDGALPESVRQPVGSAHVIGQREVERLRHCTYENTPPAVRVPGAREV